MRAGKLRDALVTAFILAAAFVPFVKDRSWVGIIPVFTMFAVLAWERFAPRNAYNFTGPDNLKYAAYNLVRPALALTFGSFAVPLILGNLQTPWGMNANGVPVWIQGIVFILVWDAKEFAWHWASHRFDFLWKFHKVHHGSAEISVFAWAPTSFIDDCLSRLPTTMAAAALLGIDMSYFPVFMLVPIIFAAQLPHANVNFPKPGSTSFWAKLLSSPNYHAHHHTVDGMRSNYGQCFAFWDLMLGTYNFPNSKPVDFGNGDPAFAQQNLIMDQVSTLTKERPQAPQKTEDRQLAG